MLDEPNSNLDGEGEAALQVMLATLKKHGTTVLMIAHRPAALRRCDLVFELRNGRLVEYQEPSGRALEAARHERHVSGRM